jgi:hypothetical protein
MIAEAGGELPHDRGALFELAQQHGAAVGGDGAAIETGHHLAARMVGKAKAGLGTTVMAGVACLLAQTSCDHYVYATTGGPLPTPR